MRPKPFLIFALVCVLPLLSISALASYLTLRQTRERLRSELQRELSATKNEFEELLDHHRGELGMLAQNTSLLEYVNAAQANGSESTSNYRLLHDALSPFLISKPAYSSLAGVDLAQHVMFVVQRSATEPARLTVDTNPLPGTTGVEGAQKADDCVVISSPSMGKVLRCSTPIGSGKVLLLSDLRLDVLCANASRKSFSDSSRALIVLQHPGEILHHSNQALNHQRVDKALPEFTSVASLMTAGNTGEKFYRSANGDDWLAEYTPLGPEGISAAVVMNYSSNIAYIRRLTWSMAALSLLLGLGAAAVLSILDRRRAQGIKRVTKDVTAIAEGDLDMRVDPRSRDDMRDLARGVNLVTGRLREQLARETEMRQIESFVGVAAMLTHDLKNAINGLSMYVKNLETQFDNPAFRAESIDALTDATQKLQSLVDRLSNPIMTLSGEYRRPSATDLVPLVKKVLARTTGTSASVHKIDLQLPQSLFALVDSERIETVIENLVINALEAMAGKPGKLTITGLDIGTGQVGLVVTDTGIGMSERFVEQKLFRAFATTKKKGMGLGLYTCRDVVTANGGSIEVASKLGFGTTFRVMLPSPPSDTAEA